jgi:hypothetical protein
MYPGVHGTNDAHQICASPQIHLIEAAEEKLNCGVAWGGAPIYLATDVYFCHYSREKCWYNFVVRTETTMQWVPLKLATHLRK